MIRTILALIIATASCFAQVNQAHLKGTTSNVQDQLNAKVASTNGSLVEALTLTPSNVTAKTNVVQVSPYQSATYAAGDFGPNAGETSFEFINGGNSQRIRQTGTLQRVKASIASTAGVTGFYVKVWRKVASNNYTLIGTSDNLSSQLTDGIVDTLDLSTTIPVQVGDFVGLRVTYSSASARIFNSETPVGSSSTIYSVSNTTPSTTGYAWESQTSSSSACVVVECYMTAPVFVALGDSIMSGNSGTVSLIDASGTYVANESIPELLARATGWTHQNMAISGQEVGLSMVPRFTNDVLNLYPRIALLEGGVNDLRAGTNAATVQSAYDILLAACVANGIKPVVIGVMPFRAATSTSDAKLQARDTLNGTLRTATLAAGGVYVDPDDYIGQFYAGGDADNRWLLDDLSDPSDGLHLTTWGRMRIAQAVLDAMAQLNVRGVVNAGSLNVGSSIEFNGYSQATITGGRSEDVNGSGGRLTIKAGGAGRNSTNTAGGSLFLQSGESTGTGTSTVRIQSPTPGSSGPLDSAIETRASFNSDGVHFPGSHFAFGNDTTAPDSRFGLYFAGDAGDSTASVGLYVQQTIATTAANPPSLFWGTLSIDSAITQTSASGVRVQNPIGSGTLNNFAGLWVLPLTKGTSANTSLQLGGSSINTSGSYLIYGAETNASYFVAPHMSWGIAPDARFGLNYQAAPTGDGSFAVGAYVAPQLTSIQGTVFAAGWFAPVVNSGVFQNSATGVRISNAWVSGRLTNYASLWIPEPTGGSAANAAIQIGGAAVNTSGNWAILSTSTYASSLGGSLAVSGATTLGSTGTSMTRVRHGVATLTAGSVTVSDSTVTANSRIFLDSQSGGGTPGWLRVSARTASTSFTITSSSGTDTSTVAWMMIEP